MNCKNCKSEINPKGNFCSECGAKIIKERITIKSLLSNVLVALGWDSNFFVTLRYLLYKPQIVFKEYINGARKKYANPFTFFVISLAISLFVFSKYSGELIQMSTFTPHQQTELTESTLSDNENSTKSKETLVYENLTKNIIEFQMKYYNLISFLLLPFYTLIAFIVFRKPYNYGEHLVINTYIQSITMFSGILLFVFSLLTGINIFGIGITLLAFFYYSFAYKRLYELTFGQLLLKILKLFGILLLLFVISIIVGVVIEIIKR